MPGLGRRFDLGAPPRPVPPLVRLRLLFGGVVNQMGWFFLGFGMIFVWIFAAQSDPIEWLDFRGELHTAEGTITAIEETGASEGGSTIDGCRYSFEVDGATYDGVSYGSAMLHEPGERVTTEYPEGRPQRSRVAGMRTAIFTPAVMFVLIFPLVGLAVVLYGWGRGRRAIRLLANGEQRQGKLKSKQRTNTRVNKRYVYKLIFEFTDDRGRQQEVSARTAEPDLLEDDAEEPLLFDPYRPEDATMLDHLPGGPRIDERGEIQVGNPIVTLVIMIFPMLTLIGHGLYAYHAYLVK